MILVGLQYSYTPAIWPPLITAILLIGLLIFSWRRRSVPGAHMLAIGSFFAMLWMLSSLMEVAAAEVNGKIFWAKTQVIWQVPATTAVTCFVLEYTWPGRWLSRRNLALLSFIPLLFLALILTNNFHHLVWSGFEFNGTITPVLSPGAWFFITYVYLMGIFELLAFTWLFLHSPQHRWPVAIMLIGQLTSRGLYLLSFNNAFLSSLPMDVIAIDIAFVAYSLALFAFRILDTITLARQTAIEQMQSGMLVLDQHGRIVSFNPAAKICLGLPDNQIKGRKITQLLPAYSEDQLVQDGETEIECHSGAAQDFRYCTIVSSELKDWRGLSVGRLLIIRDVTDQKHAQVQILEQQRALAVLNERERLARELHDSLGQVLGYAGFQLDAAAKLSQDGQGEAASVQLKRLGSVIREANADVREHILNLHSAPSSQQPFFTTIQNYLDDFTDSYNIQTQLRFEPGVDDNLLLPEAQLQVFRILQEALSNARKHGRARQVVVSFAQEENQLCMTVEDDGAGFQPGLILESVGQHYGLLFMQERAEQLGGHTQIFSRTGAGTLVVLKIPVSLGIKQELINA